jgi:hypothetical protein
LIFLDVTTLFRVLFTIVSPIRWDFVAAFQAMKGSLVGIAFFGCAARLADGAAAFARVRLGDHAAAIE